jgi:hypothetical protein
MKNIILILILFSMIIFPQDKYFISKDAPGGIFQWHDPNPASIGVTGYLLYLGYPPAGVIRESTDTTYTENFMSTTPDSFSAIVTVINAVGQSAPSNTIWIFRSDTIEYIPSWPESDMPFIANISDMNSWIIAEPTIRRSKISIDQVNKKIYLFGSIGPAFIERYVDVDTAAVFDFEVNADRYQSSEFFLRISKDFTMDRTEYLYYPDKISIPLFPGHHLISLEARKNTVVLWGDPVITIRQSGQLVPLPALLKFIPK